MAYQDKEIVLISGANTGLGLEIARQLLRDHGDRFYCLIGCRTLSKGEAAVKELNDQGLTGCEVLKIQVTDDESIARAAKVVEEKFGKLDVLHVNVRNIDPQFCLNAHIQQAGIAPDKDMLPAKEPISKLIMETMATNVAGAAQTAETFVPLLSKADNPRIVFMSTGFGSLQRVSTFQSNEKWPAYSGKSVAHVLHRGPH